MEPGGRNRWTDPSSIIGLLGMAGLIFTSYTAFKDNMSERVSRLEARAQAIDDHLAFTDARVNRIEDRVDRK